MTMTLPKYNDNFTQLNKVNLKLILMNKLNINMTHFLSIYLEYRNVIACVVCIYTRYKLTRLFCSSFMNKMFKIHIAD